MRYGIILAMGGLALLAGCGNQGNKPSGIPLTPKWQGLPYHIAFDTAPTKPNPSGITIPAIKYTANPDELENRTALVVRIDTSGFKKTQEMWNQVIMGPVDIHGTEGALPADYMDATDKGVATLLGAYGINGKVKISVMLARSSLSSHAGDDEIYAKRMSDWLPIELVFKNPHSAH